MYDLQVSTGGDPPIARKLFEILTRAGLSDVKADGWVWSVTADEKDKLQLVIEGARVITH